MLTLEASTVCHGHHVIATCNMLTFAYYEILLFLGLFKLLLKSCFRCTGTYEYVNQDQVATGNAMKKLCLIKATVCHFYNVIFLVAMCSRTYPYVKVSCYYPASSAEIFTSQSYPIRDQLFL